MRLLSLAEMMICFGTISDCSILICDASDSERPALFIQVFWEKVPGRNCGKISAKMLKLGGGGGGYGSQPKGLLSGTKYLSSLSW